MAWRVGRKGLFPPRSSCSGRGSRKSLHFTGRGCIPEAEFKQAGTSFLECMTCPVRLAETQVCVIRDISHGCRQRTGLADGFVCLLPQRPHLHCSLIALHEDFVYLDWAISNSSHGQVWRCWTTRAVICSLEGLTLVVSITRWKEQDLHKIRRQHFLDLGSTILPSITIASLCSTLHSLESPPYF